MQKLAEELLAQNVTRDAAIIKGEFKAAGLTFLIRVPVSLLHIC